MPGSRKDEEQPQMNADKRRYVASGNDIATWPQEMIPARFWRAKIVIGVHRRSSAVCYSF
jgi:hypothetical protein